jgi:hypothetical protein
LFKQANKLIKQHKCGNSTDAAAEQALEGCITALQQGEGLLQQQLLYPRA